MNNSTLLSRVNIRPENPQNANSPQNTPNIGATPAGYTVTSTTVSKCYVKFNDNHELNTPTAELENREVSIAQPDIQQKLQHGMQKINEFFKDLTEISREISANSRVVENQNPINENTKIMKVWDIYNDVRCGNNPVAIVLDLVRLTKVYTLEHFNYEYFGIIHGNPLGNESEIGSLREDKLSSLFRFPEYMATTSDLKFHDLIAKDSNVVHFIKAKGYVTLENCDLNSQIFLIIANTLNLKNTKNIDNLYIQNITYLALENCDVTSIPSGLNIKKLMIKNCKNLRHIPNEYLQNTECTQLYLENVPIQGSIFVKNKLEITMKGCNNVTEVTTDNVMETYIENNTNLKNLNQLEREYSKPSQEIHCSNNSKLESIQGTSISNTGNVFIKDCSSLIKVDGIHCGSGQISLINCNSLKYIEISSYNLQIINCPSVNKATKNLLQQKKIKLSSKVAPENLTEQQITNFRLFNFYNAGDCKDIFENNVTVELQERDPSKQESKLVGASILNIDSTIILMTEHSKIINIKNKSMLQIMQEHSSDIWRKLPLATASEENKTLECYLLKKSMQYGGWNDPIKYNDTVYSFNAFMKCLVTLEEEKKLVSDPRNKEEAIDFAKILRIGS
jgi:hypothetical protein